MRIIIDTKVDGQEEIKKAIRLLYALLEKSESQRNIFESSEPGMGNLFAALEAPSSQESKREEGELPKVKEYY